ncbi:MAG: lysine--tRNA ligase [Candidatus Cloacimonadota bacterium]|nr:MAG: lysine--tRNA ligase [Candidatus Cloacimonadota bacterium]
MQNENQLIQQRIERLNKIKEMGISPYPNRCERNSTVSSLRENKEKLIETGDKATIAGRITAMRRQGKTGFANVSDETGKIQIFLKKDLLGEETYELFKLLNIGDFIQVSGTCFVTKTGEFSVRASELKILGKNIRPIPTIKEKVVDGKKQRYDKFSDVELRYRKRYLDLLLNPEIKSNFEIRAKVISAMRRFLEEKGFLEVETPVLQPLYGGANARPFITHHNTLDMSLYLRIATELYLKRLIVGGFEKVFEIGKNFRNEGMDRTHNPEFTAFEIYQAYADYNDMMNLTEEMICKIAEEVHQSEEIPYKGHNISFKRPWKRASMIDLVKEYTGYDASDFDFERIAGFCKERKIEVEPGDGPGKLITKLFDEFVEPNLIQPVFVTDFPKEVSPLAKLKPGSDLLVERFELFIAGDEFGNAFTELNDPIDQRQRLESQAKLRELGDLEANSVDEDFIQALEYGMPPTGGLGIGIDRLLMLLTNNTSIKEIILFPTMKPEEKA